MSAEKFASLTAHLLMRKGEAKPSAIVPSEPIAFPRASTHTGSEASRRTDSRQARRAIIAPIGITSHSDGSVTLTVSDAKEHFTHKEEAQGWLGDCGSFLAGDSDLFSETNGWHIAISVDQSREPQIEFRHRDQRLRVNFDGFAASMFS